MGTKFDRLAPLLMAELMREFRLTDWQAAAVAGNGGAESGGFDVLQERRPTVAGSRGGYGFFQWTGPRRVAFEAWSRARDLDPASYEANVGFLIHELRTSEAAGLAALRRASTLEEATIGFERAYERAGVKAHPQRVRWARRALEAYRAKGGNPKPLAKSRTAAAAAASAAGGAGVIIDVATQTREAAQQAGDAWSAGTWIGVALGGVIIVTAAVTLYARWDDAGRPTPWKARPAEPWV